MSLDNITGPEVPAAPKQGALLTITEAAAARIRHLLGQKEPRPEAVIVSVTSKGCSGLRYDLQYLDALAAKPKFADEISQHGVTVVIDPKATLYIAGSVMDYKESPARAGFDFANPNETGRCGCGESFSVAPELAGKR
ncbi:MAG TPA: iron-sulfur cluster assembly accessory protein [Alphaproteobacteria bacterium]|nr:iron-sulfur cluster assembly accessory protein [Alphaproteobacteria bacterium]